MKTKLMRKDTQKIRVLGEEDGKVIIIVCVKPTMPKWIRQEEIEAYVLVEEKMKEDVEGLECEERKIALQRYTMIASILPFIGDMDMRSQRIRQVAKEYHISTQTIRKYLCCYLAHQRISSLAPKKREEKESLSKDEKNMRWALNKYYYTTKKQTLFFVYKQMLKEKYCNEKGLLKEKYPSFYQFRCFYRKYNKKSNEIISRYGLSYYQRNERPLLGDGVQAYAPFIGVGLLDATICDVVYLVNEGNQIVGRPILTACVDAYSGLCCGYSLSWEGGVYSLRDLMLNVIEEKQSYCRKFGISISKEDWNCNQMPMKLVSDMGREYTSSTFEQLVELGVTITNLPPYRPELKGRVEKFFDLVQGYYKPLLKGKGVIEEDFQERGVVDYRKQACLTLHEFEKILLHCIVFYNRSRVIEDFPFTKDMMNREVKPYASCIWNDGLMQEDVHLLPLKKERLVMTLLPRTKARFTRKGLMVNKMRYRNQDYCERYLDGKEEIAACNPDNVNQVWLLENGSYIPFELIESRYMDRDVEQVWDMNQSQKSMIKEEKARSMQEEITLQRVIDVIANKEVEKGNLKHIRSTREREKERTHKDFVGEVMVHE